MKFMEIVEYIEGKNLADWNMAQKVIWLKLSELHLVDKNDASTFMKFGTYFDKFYRTEKRPPKIKEVVKSLDLKK
jgi:hypothetical protein